MELKHIQTVKLQHSAIMYHTKIRNTTFFIALSFIFHSCSVGQQTLNNIYGKEFYSGQGHLYSGIKLVIYEDSTFEYSEGGPVLTYSKGKWFPNTDKTSITLISIKEMSKADKQSPDTLFINLDNAIVRIMSKKKITINARILYVKQ